MATQIERARAGEVTPEMAQVARDEELPPQIIRERVAGGTIVIPNNTNRRHRAVGIGEGLRTKINASIGTSSDIVDVRAEIAKAKAAGMSFMAVHCGINLYTVERLKKQGYRYGGLVSKGGTFMISWMLANRKENPLYAQFDRVAATLKKFDVVLSLGNGIRAGAIHDSSDRAQVAELVINCELAEIGREMGCQMMVEGPGHVPLDEIKGNIQLEKRMSGNAPYYVLGPLPCDVGAGYDHVTAAVGAASSSRFGADLICYITPAEHLALPNVEDVREGVRVARLAAHMGDVVKLGGRFRERNREMSKARRDMQWGRQFELGLFGPLAQRIRAGRTPGDEATCTMCGDFCAAKNAGADVSAGNPRRSPGAVPSSRRRRRQPPSRR